MANTVYSNKVIEAKVKDLLSTAINARSMMSIDDSLTQSAGMAKTINTYTYSGTAEELAAGVGSTSANRGSISYTGTDYTVKMIQQAFDYTDEDYMKDNSIVDSMLKGATQVMSNKMTSDFYSALATKNGSSQELVGSTTFLKGGSISYDTIVDAISELNVEDESNLFVVIPNAWKAALRKDNDYVSAHQGDVVYNGQVGSICGLPVIATKALTDKAYVMSPEAVKLFIKKDNEIEQDRDADKRLNSVYVRASYIVALVDSTKARKIVESAT